MQNFDIDVTFVMTSTIDEKICPNYYKNLSKAYAASEPNHNLDTYINGGVPVILETLSASYFFPELFVTEATTVSLQLRLLEIEPQTRLLEAYYARHFSDIAGSFHIFRTPPIFSTVF